MNNVILQRITAIVSAFKNAMNVSAKNLAQTNNALYWPVYTSETPHPVYFLPDTPLPTTNCNKIYTKGNFTTKNIILYKKKIVASRSFSFYSVQNEIVAHACLK